MNDLVMEVPGRAVAGTILDEILEMVGWRVSLKLAWSILSEDRKLQRVITWRIENQRLEEMWLTEAMRKEERLQEVRRKTAEFKDRVVGMDWNTVVEDKVIGMEWMESEKKKL